ATFSTNSTLILVRPIFWYTPKASAILLIIVQVQIGSILPKFRSKLGVFPLADCASSSSTNITAHIVLGQNFWHLSQSLLVFHPHSRDPNQMAPVNKAASVAGKSFLCPLLTHAL